jgi:hypothetical protein
VLKEGLEIESCGSEGNFFDEGEREEDFSEEGSEVRNKNFEKRLLGVECMPEDAPLT